MKLFIELTKRAFQRQMSYRAATLAGLMTNFFFGLLRAAVLIALYGERQEVAGVTLQGAITFTGLTQAVIAFLSLFRWTDLMDSVYSGAVGSDLLKPMNYYTYWLAQDLGRASAALITRGITIMLAFAVAIGITTPDSLGQWLALGVAIFLSWLVSFSWRFIVNLFSFWTPNAYGIARFIFILSWAFSGFFMPLRFYPDWYIALAKLTPFPAMVNTLVEIYLGVLTGPQMLAALAQQAIWVLVLFAIGQVLLRFGVRRLVILGG
ncbi:MAG: ABC-2 family transporter protein [Anaerolineales bacterium]|nr:ABC-2 family transporter protein [Anaerolineales bacterium]